MPGVHNVAAKRGESVLNEKRVRPSSRAAIQKKRRAKRHLQTDESENRRCPER